MRIAYVITRSDSIGGAQVHVKDLACAMAALGHEPVVYVGSEGPFTDILRENGISSVSITHLLQPISLLQDARALGELKGRLREFGPALISSHSSKAGIIARLAGASLGIPTVFTAHGWAFTTGVPRHQRVLYIAIENAFGKLARKIITVSEFDRRLALRYRIAPAGRIDAIHNGMPENPLRADPSATPPLLASIARFERQKDHATLIRALAGLRQLDWRLKLVGDGELRPEIERQVHEALLSERVEFVGTSREVPRILAGAQAFVLISNWEGLPRTILEAMRASLPVIASDVGGVRQLVLEGRTGFLVPRGDDETLRERLATLIASPALRREMGEQGRLRFELHFTFERMLAKTLAVYAEVTDSPLAAWMTPAPMRKEA